MKSEIVYRQMWLKGLRGRVAQLANGKLVAEVETSRDNWKRASTRQAAGLFRNALSLRLLTPGAKVVAWDGSRLVQGNYVGPACGEYEVIVSRGRSIYTLHVLPLDVARSEGVWSFRKGMQVAAHVGEKWVRATWLRYEEGSHIVRLGDNSVVASDRAHTAADAQSMNLIND